MLVSHDHRFIFFSNPKTGSESVRELLASYADVEGIPMWEASDEHPYYSHIRPVEVREIFRERGHDFGDYFRFTFVRNPWSRLVSLYEMIYEHRRYGVTGRIPAFLRDLLGIHTSPSAFRRWLRSVRPDGSGGGGPEDQRWKVYGTYSLRSFAGDEDGNLLVDEVLRLEDIETALPATLREIGLEEVAEKQIPRANTRRHPPHPEYYDEATVDLVRRRYAYEIERFGYGFGE